MRIQRIFHPVGQGAFYTECITNKTSKINIVYDCGTKSSEYNLTHEIDSRFESKEDIEWLFISHFHKDHVSGIDHLAGRCTIKNVVIPYMDKASRNLCLIDYLMSLDEMGIAPDPRMKDLIEDPNGYFQENEIKVYHVLSEDEIVPTGFSRKSSEETVKVGDWSILGGEIYTNSTDETIIRGGSFQAKIGTCCWQLKPFNYKYNDCRKIVITELLKIPLDLDKLEIVDICKHKDTIKEIYEGITSSRELKDFNDTSLTLYSGKLHESNDPSVMKGCLYCGDISLGYRDTSKKERCPCCGDVRSKAPKGTLKKSGITKAVLAHYKEELPLIGTIQIPHHGSETGFHPDFWQGINANPQIFRNGIISYGVKFNEKSLFHPHADTLKKLCCVAKIHCVTEYPSTLYTEEFRC